MQTISSRRLYLTIHQSNPSIRFPYRESRNGKNHFTEIIQTTHKNTVVVAPTGIAALNAGGAIHSMFQLPFEDLFQIIHRLNFLKVLNLKPKLLCVGISK
jgi:hypothetical protein